MNEAMHDVHRIMRRANRLAAGIAQSYYTLRATTRKTVSQLGHPLRWIDANRLGGDTHVLLYACFCRPFQLELALR